jgi:hypothetical protein
MWRAVHAFLLLRRRPTSSPTIKWAILPILLFVWLFGYIAHAGGQLIHVVLVVAVIRFVVNFLTTRRTV